MFSIATVNVNGIRAAFRRGMDAWITEQAPDVILLQEVRANDDILTGFFGDGWHLVHEEGAAKGRAGVAIASRVPMQAVRIGIGPEAGRAEDQLGRWVEADLDVDGTPLTVVSTYIHSGTAGTPSMDLKYAFLDQVTTRLGELADQGGCAVVGGDVNVAHRELDIKNWKGNRKNSGFLPEERAWLGRVFDEAGYADVVRRLHPDRDGPYSWWSYRGRAFDNDAGWRIDLICTSPGVADRAVKAYVERPASHAERWSDHAPVTAVFDV